VWLTPHLRDPQLEGERDDSSEQSHIIENINLIYLYFQSTVLSDDDQQKAGITVKCLTDSNYIFVHYLGNY